MEKLFLALCLLFVSCGNNKKTEATTNETSQQNVTETKTTKEPKILVAGDELTFPSKNGGEVKFLFKEVNTIKLSGGTYNLVLKVQIKNNLTQQLLISDVSWKLTDTDMIEVEESGVYDSEFGMFSPAMFFFTTVDAGFGKMEEVGYKVNKGTYYLSIWGYTSAKIEIRD